MADSHSVPPVATLIDLPTLIAAMKAVIEPAVEQQARAITTIQADIDQKHKENQERRHDQTDRFDASLGEQQLMILEAKERVLKLELQVKDAMGEDGKGGAIKALQDGQTEQLRTTGRIESKLDDLAKVIDEWSPTITAIQEAEATKVHNRDRREQWTKWGELIIKYGTIIGLGIAAIKHFKM